jgi:hypothetical protein
VSHVVDLKKFPGIAKSVGKRGQSEEKSFLLKRKSVANVSLAKIKPTEKASAKLVCLNKGSNEKKESFLGWKRVSVFCAEIVIIQKILKRVETVFAGEYLSFILRLMQKHQNF